MSELSLRPAHNDHRVIGDLLAPGSRGWASKQQPLFQRLVLDAHVAVRRPELARDAALAGVPVAIDPMTFLLQSSTDPEGTWSRLPFAASTANDHWDFASDLQMGKLVGSVVDFELEQGCSVVVAPYFYARDPADPLFLRGLSAITATRRYLDSLNTSMSLLPVLCGRVDGFGPKAQWGSGIDWFAHRAKGNGAESVAIMLSPLGDFSDSYSKTFNAFAVAGRLQGHGLRVHFWRQGALGSALLAGGAVGYETGLQYGNKTDISSLASSRRPRPESEPDTKSGGGGGGQVFVSRIGRWVSGAQYRALAEAPTTRHQVACESAECCSSFDDTLSDPRAHAVRSHARAVARIDGMPSLPEWRMHAIAEAATASKDAATSMNKVLRRAGLPSLKTTSFQAVHDVAVHFGAIRVAA